MANTDRKKRLSATPDTVETDCSLDSESMHAVCMNSVMLDFQVTRQLETALDEKKSTATRSTIYVTPNWELEINFEFEEDNQYFVETFFVPQNGWIPRYNG